MSFPSLLKGRMEAGQRTLENDTKRTLPNLLSDPEVIAHDAI